MIVDGKPRFSVIITCYNYKDYVAIAIESVLNQPIADFELIVVNDGSTDTSWSVISRYSDRIIGINTENRGFISACLTGLAASRGQYVLFLDADDILDEKALLTVSPYLEPDVTKIQYMLQPIDAQGQEIGDAFPRLTPDYDNQKMIESINRHGYYPTPPTSGNIYRRDVYLTIGAIDYDFGIDGIAYLAAPFKGRVVHIDQALGKYRIHNNNMSGFGSSSHLGMEKTMRVFRLRLAHLERLSRDGKLLDGAMFEMKPDYLYLVEHEVFAQILKGQRIDLPLIRRYCQQIAQSFSSVETLSRYLVAVVLFLLPNSAARAIVEFRINPKKNSPLRTMIKRLFRR
ncbi:MULTISPECIES: glycosyltransferase family 2 protein [unclassified Rhizobium]|uniref:glycosyltransferase family 2 protein n=1 Tax=unclassified Rhizobium TaxID=2613769 RepID=UPI001ADCAEC9|nr:MULTISPECIES: glycosyltransferase family 2 protein [unclassified Rhizobium]MBO9101239.1 glycosyltransferase family 2 protein [Rhizobium sp. L58/93]MBO9135267.1 glycosyltransferase family 2 protein [Rhizobium sp. B209b/85]MBO9171495.1 glycosyltransferase family 2 protein [Rhizobium sp. L245/93]MBO9187362.1 glycosyltransferase family 2 protein [Rhizobium sp. E27B/91]QXZ80838.1 glycosyltransferase family 2 protein [Rhizobium sp. L51/94]